MKKAIKKSVIGIAVNTVDSTLHLQLTQELYRSFDFFNDYFCNGKLTRPVILAASVERQKAHGWFAPSIWQEGQTEQRLNEINIGAESLKRDYTFTLATLLHEMAHLKNYEDNDHKVVDCTDQGRHNNKFKVTAEFFGLLVSSSKRFGPAHTEVGTLAMKAINELKPKVELYDIYRSAALQEKKEKKNVSKLKPVMVDEETKKAIETSSKALGVSQKEFTKGATELLSTLPSKVREIAEYLHKHRNSKLLQTADAIEHILIGSLMPQMKKEGKEESK